MAPDPPQLERGVFFVGFPGDGREIRPYRGGGKVEIDWDAYTALAIANSVSETGITLVFQAGSSTSSSSLFLKASRADCLNPDGTISRYPNPMAYQKRGRERA